MVVVTMTHTGCVTRIPPVPSLAFCPTFRFFCDAQRKGYHIQPRGSRRVSLLCLLCSGPLGGDQLIPSIIIGLPAAHYSLSPLLLQRLLHTIWIVVDADKRKTTKAGFPVFEGKKTKVLEKARKRWWLPLVWNSTGFPDTNLMSLNQINQLCCFNFS